MLAAVSRGNDGLDDGPECVCISTQTDHLETETVRTGQFFETCTQTQLGNNLFVYEKT